MVALSRSPVVAGACVTFQLSQRRHIVPHAALQLLLLPWGSPSNGALLLLRAIPQRCRWVMCVCVYICVCGAGG